MLISLDTETTGVDFVHGAAPFLVTTCDDEGVIRFWEWDVDPLTRKPIIPPDDLYDIAELIDTADLIYAHNAKFDVRAMAAIGVAIPWAKVRDTLTASHLLASNRPHNLTWLCIEYLGVNIEPFEVAVKNITQQCRAIAKKLYPQWRLADEGLADMPSVKVSSKRDEDKPWKNDMWLPRALAKTYQVSATNYLYERDFTPKWLDACSKYANADSEYTLPLGLVMEKLIRERGYWAIYEKHRIHLPRVACEMESYGVTAVGDYTESTIQAYEVYSAECADQLQTIAKQYGHNLEVAEGASVNDNMRDFFYGALHQSCPRCKYTKRVKHWNGETSDEDVCPKCAKGSKRRAGVSHKLLESKRSNLNLPVILGAKTRNASLDKDAMQEYLHTTDGNAYDFIKILTDKRKHDTVLTYMQGYRRYWVPVKGSPGFYRIHPSLNPCATDHLRWASNSPNLQNVGKQEQRCEECDGAGCQMCAGTGLAMLSARNCFGPAPDREWWSMDFSSIEKRIPAYECMEQALVELFEKPNAPPYWGSDHNLLCSILWPDLYWPLAEKKDAFKKRYINEYKKAKNTNFAKQYGAGKRKVDATAGIAGAFDLIDRGMPELAKLQRYYLDFAERYGFVETLPDASVDPERGYPILASRTEDGRVLSTTPFNYHVSGTACWCKNTALVRCADKCAEWRADGFDANIALEIHDELLFDFPRGATMEENLPRAMELKALMEMAGENLIPRIPTPVSVEYHTVSWAEGVQV